jgi:hypothetical protein
MCATVNCAVAASIFEKFLSRFADIDLRSPAPSARPEQVIADEGWACLAAAVTLVAGEALRLMPFVCSGVGREYAVDRSS